MRIDCEVQSWLLTNRSEIKNAMQLTKLMHSCRQPFAFHIAGARGSKLLSQIYVKSNTHVMSFFSVQFEFKHANFSLLCNNTIENLKQPSLLAFENH